MKCVIMTQTRRPKTNKNLHLKGGVNKWKWGKWVAFLRIGAASPPPAIKLHKAHL